MLASISIQSEVNHCGTYVYVHTYVCIYRNAVRSTGVYYVHSYIVFANNQVAYSTDAPNNDDNGGDNTGAIVGGVVGGLAGAILLILPIILLWFYYIRKREEKSSIASMYGKLVYIAVW